MLQITSFSGGKAETHDLHDLPIGESKAQSVRLAHATTGFFTRRILTGWARGVVACLLIRFFACRLFGAFASSRAWAALCCVRLTYMGQGNEIHDLRRSDRTYVRFRG
jgi:hypothetical protein